MGILFTRTPKTGPDFGRPPIFGRIPIGMLVRFVALNCQTVGSGAPGTGSMQLYILSAVKEFKSSYHNSKTMSFTIYLCFGNLNQVPWQQPSIGPTLN